MKLNGLLLHSHKTEDICVGDWPRQRISHHLAADCQLLAVLILSVWDQGICTDPKVAMQTMLPLTFLQFFAALYQLTISVAICSKSAATFLALRATLIPSVLDYGHDMCAVDHLAYLDCQFKSVLNVMVCLVYHLPPLQKLIW